VLLRNEEGTEVNGRGVQIRDSRSRLKGDFNAAESSPGGEGRGGEAERGTEEIDLSRNVLRLLQGQREALDCASDVAQKRYLGDTRGYNRALDVLRCINRLILPRGF
jgi:hypothetical protein